VTADQVRNPTISSLGRIASALECDLSAILIEAESGSNYKELGCEGGPEDDFDLEGIESLSESEAGDLD
jgi:hypothetical protein